MITIGSKDSAGDLRGREPRNLKYHLFNFIDEHTLTAPQ